MLSVPRLHVALWLQVSVLFRIASSKGGPPIPESLSPAAKDFLQLCCNRCLHSPDPQAERCSGASTAWY